MLQPLRVEHADLTVDEGESHMDHDGRCRDNCGQHRDKSLFDSTATKERRYNINQRCAGE